MGDSDGLKDRGRALEEDYFRKRDRELIEKMRQSAASGQATQQLGAATGVTDPGVLEELRELGFTAETIALLPLVPILQVAWAEGGVTRDERDLLVTLARTRGVVEGSAADGQLAAWMNVRPDEVMFQKAGRLIRALLDSGAPSAGGMTAADVVQQAEQIAAASGGMFGLRRVSAEEKALLAKIAADLETRHS